MKLKLQENPTEWLKFTAVIGTMAGFIWTVAWWKGWHQNAWWFGWVPGMTATVLCALVPRWFRGFYRIGTMLFFYLGQVIAKVVLTLFFLLILTPLGFFLRLSGNDLLRTKPSTKTETYWQEPRPTGGHKKMF